MQVQQASDSCKLHGIDVLGSFVAGGRQDTDIAICCPGLSCKLMLLSRPGVELEIFQNKTGKREAVIKVKTYAEISSMLHKSGKRRIHSLNIVRMKKMTYR